MDNEPGKALAKLLGIRDLHKIPAEMAAKMDKFIEQSTTDLLTHKALYDTTKRNYDELQRKYDIINNRTQDDEAKVVAAQQNASELRQQLDIQKNECRTLSETIQRLEAEVLTFRHERNAAYDERDQSLKMSERQCTTIERLQCDINTLESQLQAAIASKCEALVRCDEVDGREHSLDQREKFMEQERNMLHAQIANLTDNLNKNMSELQTMRQENTVTRLQVEADLAHKTEELKIATAQICQYTKSNQELINQTEQLNLKLKEQNDEATKMMAYYQRELAAKDQLCDIYKSGTMENEAEKTELKSAIESLRKMINDATEEYGQMETKLRDSDVEHAKQLAEKDEIINQHKEELANANELLKASNEENVEHMLERMTPSAAAASRRLKSGMSLTQIYSLYVKAAEDLQLKERECIQTENQLKTILQELEEKAPEWKRQKIEYQNVVATNEELNAQLDKLINERVTIRAEVAEASDRFSHMERENKQLKSGQADLARQVCYLLKEVEQMRGGFSSEHEPSISSDMSSNELISKKLVTFSDIVELQDNNQKLLLLVRDLSSRLEEMEEQQSGINLAAYEEQIAQYNKRFSDMEKDAEAQNKLIANCIRQKDRFKRLYYEIMSDVGKMPLSADGSMNVDDDEFLQTRSGETSVNGGANLNGTTAAAVEVKDKRIAELEANLKDSVHQLKQLREEYNEYRKEKLANDKLKNEQFEQMLREVRELTGTNCNLMSSEKFHAEQIKIQQKNVDVYKKQIQTLESMNRNYDKTIAKHEQSMAYLRDQCMQAQQCASASDLKCDELERLARKLQDDVSRLSIERESLHRERQSQNLLQNNLEMIKTTFERNENHGRIRMEQRFDESQRDCAALRRRLQEEQDHYRALADELNRKTETCVQKMNDELAQGDGLRKTIEELRAELEAKSTQIDHLSKQLQESLTPHKLDNPIARANKKAKELELKLDTLTSELDQERKAHALKQTMVEQLTKVSSEWEATSKEVQQTFEQFKAEANAELATLRLNETKLKSRIEEQETEIRLQITDAQMSTTDTTTELHKTQTELRETLQKVSENNRELRELRSECQLLKNTVQSAEQKYSNEIQLHSSDIQALTMCKDELNKLGDLLNQLTVERDAATEALKSHQSQLDNVTAQLSSDKQELEERIQNLDKQNAALHDQLQAITVRMSSSLNESVNDSAMADSSMLNRSLTEDDANNTTSDQYMCIIKFLRKEKDIAIKKEEILRAANTRLETEASILQKKLAEAIENTVSSDRRTDLSVVSAAKHEEILRKMETLNAITDSNRCLRSERDALEARVQEVTSLKSKLEDELFPLQEKNRELTSKIETLQAETVSLRRSADQWQKRATSLVERTNKNPEDFKRLQNERENLAKMLTSEKDTNRVVTDELAAIKVEKARCDAELSTLQRQLQALTEEKKKFGDDIVVLRQQVTRFNQEVMELKNNLLTKEDELKQLSDTLATKETQLNDIRGKESKVRLIAKRYKDMYYDIKTKSDEREADMSARPLAEQVAAADELAAAAAARQEAEATKARVVELTNHVTTLENDLKRLMAENEALKKNTDSAQLQETKARLKAITEAHGHIQREFQSSKVQLQSCEQGRSDQDLLLAGLKSQYEGRINRIEKEMSEQDAANKETIARLTRENENLNLRVNQFHRQLQSQGSKPSTSSGPTEKGPSDAVRTANVKPMAGPSGTQSASVTPRRGGDTPLASIRPMSVQNSRTAAVLPTSQTSNVVAVQGSSTGSVTALVPPQQQVHTSSSSSAEAMSSSPTSSHTDYMPATSSAVVAAVPPMGSASTSAESSQEAESIPCSANVNESSASSQAVVGQQQTVALVSPRIEVSVQSVAAASAAAVQQQAAPQPSPQHQQVADQNQAAASTSSGSSSSSTTSSSSVALSTHHQASSSNTVTTTQAAGHKRPRDPEGDSSTGVEDSSASVSSDANKTSPKNKRTRLVEQAFQGVSESGIDVEYQVPTSSQRDQEDDNVIVVDSDDDDEDEGMADEGPTEQFEEESYDQEQDDEGEGPDIDEEDNVRDTNEVEVDDSSDAPNQSAAAASGSDVGTSGGSVLEQAQLGTSPQNAAETQQIQTISSGSEVRSSSSSWGGNQLSAQNLILQQAFEETGDDSIVPSTPTLYATRRTDGFSEAVSSPHPQVPQQHAARFTFNEQAGTSRAQPSAGSSSSNVQLDVVPDDSRVDVQHDQSMGDVSRPTISVQVSPQAQQQQQVSPSQRSVIAEPHQIVDIPVIVISDNGGGDSSSSSGPDVSPEPMDAVAGPSGSTSQAGEASVAPEDPNDSATTSHTHDDSIEKHTDGGAIDEEMGADGVTSEGEKVQNEGVRVEEGREAEATIQVHNTRSRSHTPRGRGRPRQVPVERPTPIVWHDGTRASGSQTPGAPSPADQQTPRSDSPATEPTGRGRGRRMKRGGGGQHSFRF